MDFVVRLTGITHSGEIAVFIFFFFSGALIFKSISTSESILSYATKRFFRIFPPLAACIFFCVGLGLVFTNLSPLSYIKNAEVYHYISSNLSLIWNAHFLPGLFSEHPDPAINGSLWSITLEARLYLVVGVIGMLGVLRNRETANMVIILMLIGVLVFPSVIPLIGSDMNLLGHGVFPQYTVTFLLGGFVYYNNSNFILRASTVFILGLLLILSKDTVIFKSTIMIFSIALAYYIGTRSLIIKWRLPADVSYGIYLYGWPSSQLVYHMLPSIEPELNAFLSCILAGILAIVSWFCIEKPSINFARRHADRLMVWKSKIIVRAQKTSNV